LHPARRTVARASKNALRAVVGPTVMPAISGSRIPGRTMTRFARPSSDGRTQVARGSGSGPPGRLRSARAVRRAPRSVAGLRPRNYVALQASALVARRGPPRTCGLPRASGSRPRSPGQAAPGARSAGRRTPLAKGACRVGRARMRRRGERSGPAVAARAENEAVGVAWTPTVHAAKPVVARPERSAAGPPGARPKRSPGASSLPSNRFRHGRFSTTLAGQPR